MASRRVLVTGGAGFLGSHLAERLAGEGCRVRLFDTAAAPGWAASRGVEHRQGDIRDAAAVDAALEGVDAVIHAAFASPRESVDLMHAVNVDGMRNLCRAAGERGVGRVVLISSTIVEKPPRTHPFLPHAPLSRLDAYRASRVEAEAVAASSGLSVAVVRPKTFVGPGRVSAFAILFESIRLGQPVPLLGGGANRYQLLDVRDMAGGIASLLGASGGGVFHLGAREFGTVREDLQELIDHAGTGAALRAVPALLARIALRGIELAALPPLSEWHTMSARGVDSVVDISRAERELGWRPERSNATALCAGYDWYVETLDRTGTARTTHPVPRSHRLLRALQWLLPR